MEALERQSDNLIAALKPDDESISLRRSVFLFVEKIITECFSDAPVRTSAPSFALVSWGSTRTVLPAQAGQAAMADIRDAYIQQYRLLSHCICSAASSVIQYRRCGLAQR